MDPQFSPPVYCILYQNFNKIKRAFFINALINYFYYKLLFFS